MFKLYKQYDAMDCGPTCLRMIAKHYGRSFRQQTLSKLCELNREGVSLLGIGDAAEKLGFETLGARLNSAELTQIDLPCILHWRQHHFVVLYKIKNGKYFIADPAAGLIKLGEKEFNTNWLSTHADPRGFTLLLSPTKLFYEQKNESASTMKWSFFSKYFLLYRKLILQLILGLGAGSLIQLIVPFLTQSIVDVGIRTQDLNFIIIILIAQTALMAGRVFVEFIRSWILLHITTRISISILTDFLIKLMNLPISYFDSKMTGDIMQRMNDQRNVQTFLTNSTLTTLFSLFNLIVFSIILAYYNAAVFFVFLLSSVVYAVWTLAFLKRRRDLNYKNFEIAAKNQSNIVQLIDGMQEIKLNNSEQQKRWEWERLQTGLFKFNVSTLALNQYQQGGATLINEGKNILITYLSAVAVMNGHLTLGAMVAVQYIVGQLSSPVEQINNFVISFQDARISLERLDEIHQLENEQSGKAGMNENLPVERSIILRDVGFTYPGAGNDAVLKKVNLTIPEGKTTAIVGMSGSGKTTVLKLLLRFYEPGSGSIRIGQNSINQINFKLWRDQCGVVMQDGFIFSDTIERNIAVGQDDIDAGKLGFAIKVANIQDLIDGLPLGLGTKIGADGNGISQGQRQRILIARAVYKDPAYIFFDEATNALDSNNEKEIIDNMKEFFRGRTVVVVAHRLSTVTHADNIVLLHKGEIIEQGTHEELIKLEQEYYSLVKNQLALGL